MVHYDVYLDDANDTSPSKWIHFEASQTRRLTPLRQAAGQLRVPQEP